ncbi:MAG: hypothetical protein V3V25_06120 [Paracoccaceae bacterium]
MGKLFKLVLFLIMLAAFALVGYAYIGDLSPQQSETRQPVILDVD